jgi:hypothetical protein
VRLDWLASIRAAWLLLVIGVLLLLPGACSLVSSAPNRDDAAVGFAEVVRIRLDSLRAGSPIKLVFSVPDTAQWRRLRDAWGDHGYIVYAARMEGSTPWIIPFSTLNLDVTISSSAGDLALEPASGCPYLISSDAGDDCAVAFKPRPGDELEITVTARGSDSLPAGDFVIGPYWGGYEKDRIVAAMLESEGRPYLLAAAAVGVALLIGSSILAIGCAGRRQRS